MKRTKTIIIAAILLIVLLFTEVMIVKNISNYEPKIKVVYAKERIPENTEIKSEMLIEKEIVLSLVSLQSVKSKEEIIGKVAKSDIEQMEMIMKSRIGEKIEKREIKILDKSNRLFTIEFKPDQANGWWLDADQRVDIIFVPNESAKKPSAVQEKSRAGANSTDEEIKDKPNKDFNPEGVVKLEDIRIAAIIDEAGEQVKNGQAGTKPILISFEISPDQDKFLAWAKANGRIEVSVRQREVSNN